MRDLENIRVAACRALAIASIFYLVGCSSPGGRPPNSTKNTPSYPGAQQVQTQNLAPSKSNSPVLTSFLTTDRPDIVLAYYKDLLLNDGWRLGRATPTPNSLSFGWVADPANATYQMDIVTTPLPTGLTKVEITLFKYYSN